MRFAVLALLLAACTSARNQYYAAAWSPDGRVLAIGTGHSLRLEDAETRELISEFETPDAVEAIAFSSDGRHILCGGPHTAFTLRAVAGGAIVASHPEIKVIGGYSAAMSRDGRTILSPSADNDYIVWEHPFDKPARHLVRGGYPWTCALTPDGKRAIGTTPDGEVFVWDTRTGGLIARRNPHNSYIRAMVMSRDGKRFVTGTGSRDMTVGIWDTGSFGMERLIEYGTVVRALALTPDGAVLAVGGNRKTITLYDLASGAEVGTIKGLPGWPTGMAFSPDGQRLFVTFPAAVAKIYPRP
ncbi:MAG: WD40 repeat domain-containing protein [Planctomycetota bacterium]|jgi:WD40 repeat protein